MQQSDLDTLQHLFDLKSKGIVTEAEYELKKFEILGSASLARDPPASVAAPDRMLAHGVPLLVGASLLFIIICGLLPDEHWSSIGDQQGALGVILLFGLWLIPHSIWLITKRGANIVLPIIALAVTGLSALAYAGSL
jgi:hypothetical protein